MVRNEFSSISEPVKKTTINLQNYGEGGCAFIYRKAHHQVIPYVSFQKQALGNSEPALASHGENLLPPDIIYVNSTIV